MASKQAHGRDRLWGLQGGSLIERYGFDDCSVLQEETTGRTFEDGPRLESKLHKRASVDLRGKININNSRCKNSGMSSLNNTIDFKSVYQNGTK